MIIVGIDPGTRNLSITKLNSETGKLDTHAIDVKTRDGYTFTTKLEEKFYLSLAYDVVLLLWDDVFAPADLIAVEKQMRTPYKLVAMALSAILMQRGKLVRDVIPRSLRGYFDIHGKTYKERKKNSLKVPFVSQFDKMRIMNANNRNSPGSGKSADEQVDMIESSLIAIYAFAFYKDLIRPLAYLPRDHKQAKPAGGMKHHVVLRDISYRDPKEGTAKLDSDRKRRLPAATPDEEDASEKKKKKKKKKAAPKPKKVTKGAKATKVAKGAKATKATKVDVIEIEDDMDGVVERQSKKFKQSSILSFV